MSDWRVIHVVNGEELTREELVNKYSPEIKKVALQMINVFANSYGVKVTVKK